MGAWYAAWLRSFRGCPWVERIEGGGTHAPSCRRRAERDPGPRGCEHWALGPGSAVRAVRDTRFELRVRLALGIDDLLELAQHVHARQQLLQRSVRLALLLDGGDELAVLELDAVHG